MSDLQQISETALPVEVVLEAPAAEVTSGTAATFTRNALISVARLFVSTLVALVLPAYLTHKLPVKTYSSWVLILQMSAYVSYLEFGIQTGISKYVAEFRARRDDAGASMRASAGLALMLMMSGIGIALTIGLAWRVPHLFNEMPAAMYHDVRISLLFIGISLSLSLVTSICAAIFVGLQRYGTPVALSLVNRFLYTGAVMWAVYRHSSLAVMGITVAAVHLLTGAMQVIAWRRMKDRVHLTLRRLDPAVIRQMLGYCSSLAIWSAGMLCVSGLDVTIVGRYDFGQTAFYSIAVLPTNFMIAIMGAALAPLLPTASALAVQRTPAEMGSMLAKTTRYSSLLLILCGLPLLVGGEMILRLWVGPAYAAQAIPYLRILVLANMLRNLCLPYSSMLIATSSQKVAIIGASAEASVNLISSVLLAKHFGAIGVAYGTLLGSFVSVGMHFALSMRYTYPIMKVTRLRLLLSGMLRPALVAAPSLILVRLWWRSARPELGITAWTFWAVTTCAIAWWACLEATERQRLIAMAHRRFARLPVTIS